MEAPPPRSRSGVVSPTRGNRKTSSQRHTEKLPAVKRERTNDREARGPRRRSHSRGRNYDRSPLLARAVEPPRHTHPAERSHRKPSSSVTSADRRGTTSTLPRDRDWRHHGPRSRSPTHKRAVVLPRRPSPTPSKATDSRPSSHIQTALRSVKTEALLQEAAKLRKEADELQRQRLELIHRANIFERYARDD